MKYLVVILTYMQRYDTCANLSFITRNIQIDIDTQQHADH